jgi:hypothetical protein
VSIPPSRVFAAPSVLRDAERLLPGRVLELEVERAILAGRKRTKPLPGVSVSLRPGERFVLLDQNAAAVIAKAPSPLLGQPSWRITRLLQLRPLATRAA